MLFPWPVKDRDVSKSTMMELGNKYIHQCLKKPHFTQHMLKRKENEVLFELGSILKLSDLSFSCVRLSVVLVLDSFTTSFIDINSVQEIFFKWLRPLWNSGFGEWKRMNETETKFANLFFLFSSCFFGSSRGVELQPLSSCICGRHSFPLESGMTNLKISTIISFFTWYIMRKLKIVRKIIYMLYNLIHTLYYYIFILIFFYYLGSIFV